MITSRSTRSGWRWAKASPTAPQSCTTSRTRSTSSCVQEALEEAVVLVDRVAQVARLARAPEAGQVGREAAGAVEEGAASRRSWWARRAGRAAPRAAGVRRRPGALRQKIGSACRRNSPEPRSRARRCGRSPRAPARIYRRSPGADTVIAVPARARPRGAGRAPTRARVVRVRDRLREVYGVPLMAPHGDPIAELVLTVLSQTTNDRNRDVAYLRLRERMRPTLGAGARRARRPRSRRRSARAASRRSSRRASRRSCGRSPPDPPRDHGPSELSLDWLASAPVEQARDYLLALPGVGRKTAACVLLFAYGLRDVPVDTHVSRVGMRLGLLRAGRAVRGAARPDARADAARAGAGAARQPAAPRPAHLPRAPPACGDCALARMCPSSCSGEPHLALAACVSDGFV